MIGSLKKKHPGHSRAAILAIRGVIQPTTRGRSGSSRCSGHGSPNALRNVSMKITPFDPDRLTPVLINKNFGHVVPTTAAREIVWDNQEVHLLVQPNQSSEEKNELQRQWYYLCRANLCLHQEARKPEHTQAPGGWDCLNLLAPLRATGAQSPLRSQKRGNPLLSQGCLENCWASLRQ